MGNYYAQTMKLTTGIIIPVLAMLCASTSYSQTEVHSGMLHTQTSNEEFSLIKIHCEGLQQDVVRASVQTELSKYPTGIYSFEIDQTNEKIYLKFHGTMNPNLILGILDRVNIQAYYLENGSPVFYEKSGSDSFVR